MVRNFLVILGVVIFSSCEVKPVAINYGSDACHFCKMTIVDQQHSAEIVTQKRKPFKYDAIECMMNDLTNWQEAEPGLYLVADYSNPGELIDATIGYYLISEAIPSPMGAFLSAFGSSENRQKTMEESNGDELSWDELKIKYSVK